MKWGVPRSRLTHEEQIDELLARATDDWLQPADIFDIARFAGDTDEDAYVERAIRLVEALLREGLVVPGDVSREGFRPWASTIDESLNRIASVWQGDHDAAPVSFVAWLEATQAGHARGERALLTARLTDG
ncbi:hypothetical protein [Terrabacter sp. 2YAF2]|uniref:hypothetical protein n=1 Tax=Terrabacter sp. 2YAF2 TaxID=3233026 RepID=UPI003F9E27BB